MMSPKIEEFDEEIEKEGLKKTMKKVKEVFHEWEQLNMNKLLLGKVVDVPVVQVPQFIDGVDVPVIVQRRGVLHTVKVPQTHFIDGVSGHSCCATVTGYAQRKLCCWLRGSCTWRWGRR